jgi:hypothetical protein
MLRGAARAAKPARFRMALSALVSEARLVFGACFFIARASPAPVPNVPTRPGRDLHSWIRSLLALGFYVIPNAWQWNMVQCSMLLSHLLSLVASSPQPPFPAAPDSLPLASVDWIAPPRPYPATLIAFLHSLRVGLPWAGALESMARLPPGQFSTDGRVFCVPSTGLPSGLPDSCLPLCDPGDPDALTMFFSGSTVAAIC